MESFASPLTTGGSPSPRRRKKRESLPPGSALVGLPDNIAAEFHRLAKQVIDSRFIPHLWLRSAKRHRTRLQASRRGHYAGSAIVAMLKQSSILSTWPEPQLAVLSAGAHVQSYRRGEIIAHAGEPCAPAMTFLAGGAADLFAAAKPESSTSPTTAPASAFDDDAASRNYSMASFHMRRARQQTKGALMAGPASGSLKATAVISDAATMAEERRVEYLVASDDVVDLVVIPRRVLVAAFEQLPTAVTAPLLRDAALQREATLTTSAPLTESRVELARIFGALNKQGVSAVARRSAPACFSAGSVIGTRDAVPHQLLFVRRGLVGLIDGDGRRVSVLRDGSALFEREFYFGEKPQYTAVALCNVDGYAFRHVDLVALKSQETHAQALGAAAAKERERELHVVRTQRSHMLEGAVRQIPLFSYFATDAAVADIVNAMAPRILNSPDLIATTAEACNRRVILTRGAALVRNNAGVSSQRFHLNECIGYTCLVEHRWLHAVVALEPVDIWELPRDTYRRILSKHGLLADVVGATLHLMQPMLRRPRRCERMEPFVLRLPQPNTIPGLRTPNLHPTTLENTNAEFNAWRPEEQAARSHMMRSKRTKVGTGATEDSAAVVAGGAGAVHKEYNGSMLCVPDEDLYDVSRTILSTSAAAGGEDSRAAAGSSEQDGGQRAAANNFEEADACHGASAADGIVVVDTFGNAAAVTGFEFPAPPLNPAGNRMRPVTRSHTAGGDDKEHHAKPAAHRTDSAHGHDHQRRALAGNATPALGGDDAAASGARNHDEGDDVSDDGGAAADYEGQIDAPTESDRQSVRLKKLMRTHQTGSTNRVASIEQTYTRWEATSKPPPKPAPPDASAQQPAGTRGGGGAALRATPRPPSASTPRSGSSSRLILPSSAAGSSSSLRPSTARQHRPTPRTPAATRPSTARRADGRGQHLAGDATSKKKPFLTPAPLPPQQPTKAQGKGRGASATGRFAERVWAVTPAYGSLLGKMSAAVDGFSWHSGAGFDVPRAMLRDFVKQHPPARADADSPPPADAPPGSLEQPAAAADRRQPSAVSAEPASRSVSRGA